MKYVLLIAVLALSVWADFNPSDFSKQTYTNSAYSIGSMPYQFFKPANYTAAKKYALVLCLHGAGQAGTDGSYDNLVPGGPALFADNANQASHPCFIVAPQCPASGDWKWVNWDWGESNCAYRASVTAGQAGTAIYEPLQMALAIVDQIIKNNSIDTTRLYITGLSMGGWGTWDAITRFPNKFAAAAPICGGGDSSKAYRIVQGKVGVWAFHSQDDDVVPFSNSVCMIDAMTRAGGTPKHTWYNGLGHGCWDAAYSTAGLVDWFFSFSKTPTAAQPEPAAFSSRPPGAFMLALNGTAIGVTVAAGPATVSILDMSGKLIAARNARAGVRADFRVGAPGMHFAVVNCRGSTTSQQFAVGR